MTRLRSFVRFLIAPLVRWAAEGGKWAVMIFRDEDGAMLVFCDAYGEVYAHRVDLPGAAEFGRQLCAAARDHLEGVPLPADD